ncbi:hypothetical protein [Streptococcus equinus]|nr:hypothetical protein [Streptococcus equinus]
MIKTRESGGFFSICEQSFTFLFFKNFFENALQIKNTCYNKIIKTTQTFA